MNTTTHVLVPEVLCSLVGPETQNCTRADRTSYQILVTLIFIQSFLFLKDYRRIKTQKIERFLCFQCAGLFGYSNFRLGLSRRPIKFSQYV